MRRREGRMRLSDKRRGGHHARVTTALAVGAAIVLLAGGSARHSPRATLRSRRLYRPARAGLHRRGTLRPSDPRVPCVIDAEPTESEGYRGRIEAQLLLGRFSDAVARLRQRVTAFVVPGPPRRRARRSSTGYPPPARDRAGRRAALTGASFARWWFFDYRRRFTCSTSSSTSGQRRLRQPVPWVEPRPQGRARRAAWRTSSVRSRSRREPRRPLHRRRRLHVRPARPGACVRGGDARARLGLDTPRVHAILATAYTAFGDLLAASGTFRRTSTW